MGRGYLCLQQDAVFIPKAIVEWLLVVYCYGDCACMKSMDLSKGCLCSCRVHFSYDAVWETHTSAVEGCKHVAS